MSKEVIITDQSNTDTNELITDNNNILSTIESLNTLDISVSEQVLIHRATTSFVGILRSFAARAAETETNLHTRVDTLVTENNNLRKELATLSTQYREVTLLLQQLQAEKERLENRTSILEQDRVILNAQLTEYRETLQELAGYQFLGLRFD